MKIQFELNYMICSFYVRTQFDLLNLTIYPTKTENLFQYDVFVLYPIIYNILKTVHIVIRRLIPINRN